MPFRVSKLFPRVSAHSERDLFAWSLLAGTILLCLLAMPFFSGGFYTADDLGNFHLPARAFYAGQLARGQAFDWMPGIYCGFYLTGNGQVGTYHPLHHFLYRFLPLQAAMGWEYLLSYPLMLSGMYFLLRRAVGTRAAGHRRDAAMVGSLAFTFSSFNLLHFVHPNEVAAVAHIPWLLAMIDVVLVDAERWKAALAQAFFALLTGSQLLLGCPQYVWYSLLAEACFAAFLVVTRKYVPRDGCEAIPACRVCVGCHRSSLSLVIAAKAIGLMVGAVQLLPTLDALRQSTLTSGESPEGATLHPINLVQLIAPYMPIDRAFGGSVRELGLYVGAVPLMLALWVFARRRNLGGMKGLAQAAAGFALAAIVLAVGSRLTPEGWNSASSHSLPDGPAGRFCGLLWTAWFHFSCRYTVLFQLAVALLATIGFVLVEREARETWKKQRHAPPPPEHTRGSALAIPNVIRHASYLALWRQHEVLGGTVLASAAVAIAGLVLQAGHHVASPSRVLVGPLLMASAALLVIAAAHGVRGALVGLVLFMSADLGYYGLSCILNTPAARPEAVMAQTVAPPVARAAGENGTVPLSEASGLNCASRVFAPPADGDGASAIGNQMTLAGWERTDGCAALKPRKALDYYQLAALQASSTRWVHRGPSTDGIAGLAAYDEDWSQVPDPLPPAHLVTHVLQSDHPAADLARINLRREALCDRAIDLPPGTPGTAEIASRGGGDMAVKVNCSSPQLLVIAESYHPGWRCTIGGMTVPVYPVNGDFLGCIVWPGVTEVHFEFRPDSLARGRLATLVGLGLIGLCFFTAAPRRPLALAERIGLSRPAL